MFEENTVHEAVSIRSGHIDCYRCGQVLVRTTDGTRIHSLGQVFMDSAGTPNQRLVRVTDPIPDGMGKCKRI